MILSIATAILLGGCTKYEYQLEQPAARAQRITYHQYKRVTIDPLVYELRAYENHLIMRIENPTKDPIELIGDSSTIVSPDDQSHPLRNRTIAPGSFIKLIFPPVRPAPEPTGPAVGVGFGYGDGSGPVFVSGYSDWHAQAADEYYWQWKDSDRVKMHLVFRRDQKTFTQTLVFQQVKSK